MYSSANEIPPKNLLKTGGGVVDEKILFIAQTNEQSQTPKEKCENLEENSEKL